MPRKYRAGPQNIQSQRRPNRTTYYPGIQADEVQLGRLQGPHPHGFQPGGAFVVANYDSRQINSIEFLRSAIATASLDIGGQGMTGGIDPLDAANALIEYQVPRGRTLVLREWEASMAWAYEPAGGSVTTSIINIQGDGLRNTNVDLLLNQSAIPEYSSFETTAFCWGPVSGEAFIIVPEGQFLGIALTNVPMPNGFNNAGYGLNHVNVVFRGQLLLSTGQTPDFEIGNNEAIPVTNNVAELRRRGLIR